MPSYVKWHAEKAEEYAMQEDRGIMPRPHCMSQKNGH